MVVSKGTVAIFDFLGISALSLPESENFLVNKELLVKEFKELTAKSEEKKLTKYKIRTFGDTFIITWDSGNTEPVQFYFITSLMSQLFLWCLKHKLLIRGAISIGEFLESDNKDGTGSTVLGPAVNDAASWHQKANWAGMIFTPHAGMKIEHLYRQIVAGQHGKNADLFSSNFFECQVPLHDNKTYPLWTVAWPFFYMINNLKSHDLEADVRTEYKADMAAFPIFPFGTEEKYLNINKYFEIYLSDLFLKVLPIYLKKTKPVAKP